MTISDSLLLLLGVKRRQRILKNPYSDIFLPKSHFQVKYMGPETEAESRSPEQQGCTKSWCLNFNRVLDSNRGGWRTPWLDATILTQRGSVVLMVCCLQCFSPQSHGYPQETFSSVQFSHSVMSDSLQPHELQHARPPCPSPTPGVHSILQRSAFFTVQLSHPYMITGKTIALTRWT